MNAALFSAKIVIQFDLGQHYDPRGFLCSEQIVPSKTRPFLMTVNETPKHLGPGGGPDTRVSIPS
jgi:hypothetical protein